MVARGVDALTAAAESLGPLAVPFVCDVGDGAALGDVVRRVRATLGDAPDVIVNSAGLFKLAPRSKNCRHPDDFALDARGQSRRAVSTHCMRALFFRENARPGTRGHIISIGSIADRVAFPENAAYAASKFGLRGLHEVLRAELVGSGVRATLVSPGAVDTPLWDEIDPDNRAGFSPRSAMLQPSAVADAVLFAVTQPSSVNIDELRLSRS